VIRVKIVGIDDNLDRMTVDNLLTGPMKQFFWDAGQDAVRAARGFAPTWTGELRDSIGLGLDKRHSPPMFVIVGPRNAQPQGHLFWKASVAEYGAGVFATLGHRKHVGHAPPPDALESWALSHGFDSGAAVARAIRRRGGIRPKRFLHRAAEQTKRGPIKLRAAQLERNIAQEWNKP
jgi:hypothetical protein